jgi:carbohydrate binding protein with CBM4/9 domain
MALALRGSATTDTEASGTSIVINKPSGVVADDLLIAFVTSNNQSVNPPSGWTELDDDTTAELFRSHVFYKIAGSSEGSTYTFTVGSSAPIVGTIIAYDGADTVTPIGTNNHAAATFDSNQSEALTTPTVSGNTETVGRVIYFRQCRRSATSDSDIITYTEGTAGISELSDVGVYSGGSVAYSHGVFADDADFSSGGSKSGLAITANQTETHNITRTIVISTAAAGGAVSAAAGLATASATARTTSQPASQVITDELVPTYSIFIDWDNDGGLDFGNFELDTQGWAVTDSGTIIETSSEQVHIGQANSLKITWDASAGQDVWKYKQELVPGRNYTFSAWVYVLAGAQAVRLEADGLATGAASTTTGAWEYLEVEFTASSAVHTLRLEPSATPTNGDAVYMDEVMVVMDGEDVTARVLGLRTPLSFQYGRDTARSLSEIQPGETGMTLNNDSRDYSPDNTGSPLYGLVRPGRTCVVRATYNGKAHTLFNGFIDDFVLVPDAENRALEVTALDAIQKLNEATISTELYHSIQTGEAIGYVLDAVGWPSDRRDLDPGASTIRWWWEEGTDAFEALSKIIAAEGPPSITFVDSAGNFVYRDRHHRVLYDTSVTSQATFLSGSEDKITFVATGDAYSTTSAGTTFTLNQPSGVQADDLYVAFVVTDSVSTCTPPSGWTLVRSTTLDDGTDDIGMYVLVKDAAADDPSTWEGSVSVSSSRRFARVLAYRGTAPAADQFVAENANTSTGTSTTLTTPSVANTTSGGWRVALFVAHEDETNTGWGSYSPTATERFDNEIGSSDPVLAVACADSSEPVSAESGKTSAATLAGTSAVDSSASWIGIIRPWEGTGLRFSLEGFEYDIGWKDIVNSVSYSIEDRGPTFKQVVWESEQQVFVIAAGTTLELTVETDDPFYNAALPVEDTDYVVMSGSVEITLSRRSGASTTIFIKALTAAQVLGMRLQATPVPVQREVVVKLEDQTSINNHGVHSLDEQEAAWLNASDAEAVAKAILGLRAERLPLVTFQVSNSNNEKMLQILTRDLSDRIHIVENETFTDHDFFIERIEQEIEEVGWNHRAVFGCERAPDQVAGTFKFGSSGPGFDEGRLGTQGGNNSDDVLILGVGQLDQKVLGI